MNELSARWLVAAALLIAGTPLRGDVLHLKGGGRIDCIEAWIEHGTVFYRISEGVLGFPAESLERIEKTETTPAETRVAAIAPARQESDLADAFAADAESLTGTPVHEAVRDALLNEDYRLVVELLSGLEEPSLAAGMTLAFAHVKLQEWAMTIKTCERYLVEHADDPALTFYMGLSHYYLGRDAIAIRYLRRSVETRDTPVARDLLERLEKQSEILRGPSLTTSHFVIRYEEPKSARIATQIAEVLERAFADYEQKLSHSPRDQTLVLLTTRRHFYDITRAPDWSGGINDGRVYLPIGGLEDVDDEVRRVATHELVHSFLRSITNGNIPVWLNEGIAMYMTGENPDNYTRVLSEQSSKDQLVPLSGLEGSFKGFAGAQSAELAYAEALIATTYLVRQYGMSELNRMLKTLSSGTRFDDALKQRYRMDYIELEKKVREFLLVEAARHPSEGIRIR